MFLKRIVVHACVCLALGAHAAAQDSGERSVDSRLLEILKQRGVITESEFGELKQLESDLRKEADLETNVDHRVSEMVARMSQDAPKISYKLGDGFTFKTSDGLFSLSLGGRLQLRATYEERENPNGNENDRDSENIAMQRARLWFKGFAFDPHLKYELQIDVAGQNSRPPNADGTAFDSADTSLNRVAEIRNLFVDWQICPSKPWFNLKGGQFKVPYSRQQMVSAFKLEFVDRAPTDSTFAPSYSPGIMFWGTRGGEKENLFEYYAGVFDGSNTTGIAEGTSINNNDHGMLYVARVAVNPFGGMPYSESDLRPCREQGKFLMAIGANAWYHQDNNRSTTLDNFDDWSVGADVAMMWRGWFLAGELHYRNDAQPNANPDVDVVGWHAQLGYMIVPQRFEIGVRAANVDWDGTTAIAPVTVPTNSASREYLLLLAYYWHEHDMKIQLDFGRVENHFAADADGPNANDLDEWRGRMQFQLTF